MVFSAGSRESAKTFVMTIFMPGLDRVLLFIILIKTTISSLDPDFGSGADIGGVGLVFIMGVGVLAIRLVTMIMMSVLHCPFFRWGSAQTGHAASTARKIDVKPENATGIKAGSG